MLLLKTAIARDWCPIEFRVIIKTRLSRHVREGRALFKRPAREGHITVVGIDEHVPLYRIIAVSHATTAGASLPMAFALKKVPKIKGQVAKGVGPREPQVPVIGKPDVVMLVEEPTGGNSIGPRPERNAHNTGLERAGFFRSIPQVGFGQRTVSGIFKIPPPPVFEFTDQAVRAAGVEIDVDAEGIKHKASDVSASTVTCDVRAGIRVRGSLIIRTVDVVRTNGATDLEPAFFRLRCLRGLRGLIQLYDLLRGLFRVLVLFFRMPRLFRVDLQQLS